MTHVLDCIQLTNLLWIGRTPNSWDIEQLHQSGVRLVINMRVEQPSLFRRPIAGVDIVWLPTFDFPLLPIRAARIIATVDRAVAEAKRGNGVYVYCKMGRHRSVMMAAAILIALGSTPEAAISLIKEKRAAANPDIYYIRAAIMEFDHYWQERQASKRMLQD